MNICMIGAGYVGLVSAACFSEFGWTVTCIDKDAGRLAMLEGQRVPTQDFARNLIAEGYAGLLVRSFAKGAGDADLNLVLWKWGEVGCSLQVVDDEGRLDKMLGSECLENDAEHNDRARFHYDGRVRGKVTGSDRKPFMPLI